MRLLTFIVAWLALCIGASAQVGQMPSPAQLMPAPGGGGFALTYQSVATSTANTTTINYGTMTYGTGDRIIAALSFLANSTAAHVTAVTVNGVSFTQIPGAFVCGSTCGFSSSVDLWQSNSTISGTSGTVSVTYDQAVNSFGVASSIALYSLTSTNLTASTVANNSNTSSTTISLSSFAVPSGGGAIVLGWDGFGAAFSSWSNAATDQDATAVHQIYGHSTATGTITITGTWTGGSQLVIAGAAWGP